MCLNCRSGQGSKEYLKILELAARDSEVGVDAALLVLYNEIDNYAGFGRAALVFQLSGKGLSCPQDRAQANHWFHMAANQGYENAQRVLSVELPMWRKLFLLTQFVGGLLLMV